MLTRRMLFVVLSVGLIGLSASVLNSLAAESEPGAEVVFRTDYRKDASGTMRPRTIAVNVGLQNRFVEAQRVLAANLSDEELTRRIAETEKEIRDSNAAAALRAVQERLAEIKDQYPDTEAATMAAKALEALTPQN